jgi:hypothetical protein
VSPAPLGAEQFRDGHRQGLDWPVEEDVCDSLLAAGDAGFEL